MNFVSVEFAYLFVLVVPLYFLLRFRGQNVLLLATSYVFYGWWDWRFVFLMLATSLVDYTLGLNLSLARHPHRSQRVRRLLLAVSIAANLGSLGFFKYYDFFAASAMELGRSLGVSLSLPLLHVILPLGISFYTFQSMSYTIDVYRNQIEARDRLDDFLLFVSFFPHLVAGPIQRATQLLPQVATPRHPTVDGFYSGAQLAFVGFFKKMVIADNAAIIANEAFRQANPTGGLTLLGIYAFAFQIYCDFSGYSDIARGTARMLGFELSLNFRLPYFATNPSDFWQRWHISLSSWLRDYLYIPLGGNRGGAARTTLNLLVTMTLGGLWHGASWHFVVWGVYHGLLLVVFHLFQPRKAAKEVTLTRRSDVLFWGKAFLYFHLTCLGWLLFRAENLTQVARLGGSLLRADTFRGFLGVQAGQLAVLVIPLLALEIVQHRSGELEPWRRWPVWGRVLLNLIVLYAILLLGVTENNDFIYFQF